MRKLRFEDLGESVLVPFRARRMPARVLWCNFELARELGFRVPRENRLDAKLEAALVGAFSFFVGDGEVTLHADRYHGSGMGDHRGSARGGIELRRNVFIKGLGRTPLAGAADGDAWHSNGVCHITQCLAEAFFGELDAHLFTAGSARVVAILDQGQTIMFDGQLRHAAIVVRAGVPFRPAHLVRNLGEDLSDLPALFVRLTRLGGDYVATMRRLLALHARTAAEQVRWRVLHGAISTSNIGLFGEMIDLNSQSTQPRTAPVSVQRLRRTRGGSFGGEHLARGTELQLLWLSVTETLPPSVRASLDCAAELRMLYDEALEMELLHATGLSRRLADAVRRDAPALVRRYREVLVKLMALRNPGPLSARNSTCERIGVVDVFRILAHLPRRFFADETADHRATVRELAALQGKGMRKRAEKGLDELADLHRRILEVARPSRSTKKKICERAELENRPLEDCYRPHFLAAASALDAVDEGSRERLPKAVQAFLDIRIARTRRRVEAMPQRRMLDGVEHVVRSRSIEIRFHRGRAASSFHYSFDGGVTVEVARIHASRVRIPLRAHCGILEGRLSNGESVLPFVFAVPER